MGSFLLGFLQEKIMDVHKETTEHTQRVMAQAMGVLDDLFPNTGKVFLIFGLDRPDMSNYISNCSREDMITCLRETADRIEKNMEKKI